MTYTGMNEGPKIAIDVHSRLGESNGRYSCYKLIMDRRMVCSVELDGV